MLQTMHLESLYLFNLNICNFKILKCLPTKTRLTDVYFSKKLFSVFPPPNEGHTQLDNLKKK